MKEIIIPCFVKEEDYVIKYVVKVNVKELTDMRKEIIDKCSIITHHEIEKYMDEISKWKREIKNKKSLEMRNYYEYSSGKYGRINNSKNFRKIVSISYDEYSYPYLISIVDGLLKSNETKLYELLELNFDYEYPTIDEELKILEEKLKNNNDNKDILVKYRTLLDKKKLNQNQLPVDDYYYKVIDLLKVEFSSSKKMSDIEKHFTYVHTKDKNSSTKILKLRNFTSLKR